MLGDRRTLSTTVPDAESTEAFTPGAAIGRFLVLTKIGAGGMGVVYAAYDPDLDRKVAVKLLRGNRLLGATASDRDRLTAEAQAMARLADPHVVAVYELGFTDEAAFLVMELVTGRTLRDWLDERERPWPEIVAMFAAAGQGLAAAHRARIVHRDFKPANVLLDRDGRPRVADFGLAAEMAANGSPVTAGAGAGTRRYMAPEQLRGEPCDARADQFAYCVALWHAVHGSWPFAGDTQAELAAAITAGQLSPPARRTPEWLRSALTRGLAADPEARWPALDDLLRVLGRDRGARRWWIGGGLAAVAFGAAAVFGMRPGDAVDPCAAAGAVSRVAGIWDRPRQAAVQGAFYATGAVYADDTWQRVKPRIDGYVADWSRMAIEACRATRVEGRQSDTLMDLRMRCLDERRSLLGALTELWSRTMDVRALEHAVTAARGLPLISECGDGRVLSERAPLPADPVDARRVAAVRPALEAVQALILAHRWPEARRRAAAVRALADATGWAQLRAEAAFAEGDTLSALQDPSAESPLRDAWRFAATARDDRLAARALIALINVLTEDQQKASRGLDLVEIADGAVLRTGDDATLRARLVAAHGMALYTAGTYAAARSTLIDARARYAAVFGPDAPETAAIVAELARVADDAGDFPAAVTLGNEVLDKMITQLGADHPSVAAVLNNLGSASQSAGDYDAAARYYQRSLEIKMRVLGPETASTATALNNLGNVAAERGKLDEAEVLFARALAIRERVLGPDHGFVATTLGNLGEVRRMQGRYPDALALLNRALAIKTKAYGADHASLGYTLDALASVFAARGEFASALPYHRRSFEIRTKALGADHPLTLTAMANLATMLARMHRCTEARAAGTAAVTGFERTAATKQVGFPLALAATAACDLADGAPARAIASVERALALSESAKQSPVRRGQVRWVLVRALWAIGRRDEAITAAHRAERELAGDADGALDRAAVLAWLTAHSPAAKPAISTAAH